MISDRELSELVATKVMGWRKGSGRLWRSWRDVEDRFVWLRSVYLPATDAGLALEAAMRAGSGDARIVADRCAGFLAVAACATNPASAAGSTIARALCFASLRAAGVEVEDDAESGEGGQR